MRYHEIIASEFIRDVERFIKNNDADYQPVFEAELLQFLKNLNEVWDRTRIEELARQTYKGELTALTTGQTGIEITLVFGRANASDDLGIYPKLINGPLSQYDGHNVSTVIIRKLFDNKKSANDFLFWIKNNLYGSYTTTYHDPMNIL